MPKLLFALAVAQVLWLMASARMIPSAQRVLTSEEWRTHVALHGLLILVLILFSYGWFGTFSKWRAGATSPRTPRSNWHRAFNSNWYRRFN